MIGIENLGFDGVTKHMITVNPIINSHHLATIKGGNHQLLAYMQQLELLERYGAFFLEFPNQGICHALFRFKPSTRKLREIHIPMALITYKHFSFSIYPQTINTNLKRFHCTSPFS